MIGFENVTPEVAKDLIELINSLKAIPKSSKVSYSVKNGTTGGWSKKEFSYVPLDSILEKIKENNNFAFMQPIGYDKELGKFGIKCVLIHKSGFTLVSDLYEVPVLENQKIQDEGAQITYRKRYSAGAFLGIATEEDTDGNDDNAEQVKKESTKKEVPKKVEQYLATANQIEIINRFYTGDNLNKLLDSCGIKELKEMPLLKASEICKKLKELAESQEKKEVEVNE